MFIWTKTYQELLLRITKSIININNSFKFAKKSSHSLVNEYFRNGKIHSYDTKLRWCKIEHAFAKNSYLNVNLIGLNWIFSPRRKT